MVEDSTFARNESSFGGAIRQRDGDLTLLRTLVEGYAEPAETLTLSGTLGAFLYSDDNRRVQAAASARWLPVRLGRRNSDFIEVLDGLEPGERVITSPYTGFADKDRLDLNES